jgi:signal transduction histidine kinase
MYRIQNIARQQNNLLEDKRKGIIFSYFLGAVWVAGALITIQNFYLSITHEGALAEKYASFNASNIGVLLFMGLIWWGHRWYPKVMRHLFLLLVVVGIIFFFALEDLDRVFASLAFPIIMAAFLIEPIYSFVYLVVITVVYSIRLYEEGFTFISEEYSFISIASLIVIAVVSWLIARSLNSALAETRALNRELDQRVQDRTRELAQALERERVTAVRNTIILRSIADGVLVFDANQRVMIANPAANKLANQDLQSLSLTQVLATIDDKTREILQSWMKGQKPTDQNNVKFGWNNRTISANVSSVILPTISEERVDAGNVMVLRDFTREAQLERAKDLFLSMVSHELRTPMSAIQGYVNVLLQTEKPTISGMGYEYLQTIDVSIKQLLKLANELIDLSRLETGEVDLYRQWVDPAIIVNQAAKIVQQEFASRKLCLEVKVEEDLPQIYVDRNRILQVLLNLLSNAYKYTSEGGAIVEVNQSDEWVQISIADTGVGIKEEDQASMFNRFFRAGDQVVQKAGGTGLGLNISKGLTELHGGELTFESTYGKGTTFRMILPKHVTAADEEILEEELAL